jgi:basic membrane protein A
MDKGENMVSIRRLAMTLGAASLVMGTLTVSVAGTAATAASKFKACVVTDTGGINDKSFNASAYQGVKDAMKANKNVVGSYLSSTSSADYAPNINSFINKKCGIIVTVGFLMDASTTKAANAHPQQPFAIVDDVPMVKKGTHVLALTYATNQDGFLAGYLAAASTKKGTVATYGGMQFPTVAIYMDGFVAGVRYYDKTMGAAVKSLGWNPTPGNRAKGIFNGSGTFVGNFTDQTAGKTITAGDFAAGADIVFPVAGSVGLGSIAAAKAAGPGNQILWVDTDGCVSDAPDCSWFLASVTKGVEASVKAAVLSAATHKFKAGSYVGTLKNGGAALILNSKSIPASLKSKLKSLTAGIVSGAISLDPNSYPAP